MVNKRKELSEVVVHIGAGFAAKERPRVREALSSLRSHLGRWDDNDVSVEVSVQDRGRGEQRVTLRTGLPGRPPVVAVAAHADLSRAIEDAKNELIRLLGHAPVRRVPTHRPRLSSWAIRHAADVPPGR